MPLYVLEGGANTKEESSDEETDPGGDDSVVGEHATLTFPLIHEKKMMSCPPKMCDVHVMSSKHATKTVSDKERIIIIIGIIPVVLSDNLLSNKTTGKHATKTTPHKQNKQLVLPDGRSSYLFTNARTIIRQRSWDATSMPR